MAKSKLFQIWISKSEELDNELRLKTQNSDIVKNKGREAKHKCTQCPDSHAFTKEDLKKHKISEHGFSPEPWLSDTCHICPAGVDSISHTLKMHSIKGFSKVQNKFECETCKKLFERKTDMRTHLKVSFNCFRMKCPNCNFKTYIEKSFCRHKCEAKSDAKLIECEECDFKDKSGVKVSEHMGAAHDGVVLKCEFCLFAAQFKSELVKHSRVTHNVKNHLVCDSCPFVAKSKLEKKNHQEKVHAFYKIEKDGTVGCLSCDFKSLDKSRNLRNGKAAVKRHYMVIHKKVKQTCNACNLSFSNKSSLNLHKTRKHEVVVKNLKCNYCDYKTSLKWILNRHVGSMHEGRRIKCPHCHFKGYEKRHTQNHIKMYHLNQNTKSM